MLYVILYNAGFWFNFLIPIASGLYLYFTHREYVMKEFLIQAGITFVVVFLSYMLLFRLTTDLVDTEYINTKATKFVYNEKWTEEVDYPEEVCTGSGENRSCTTVWKTREDYHPPYWEILTADGNGYRISKREWERASREFGREFKKIWRPDKVSFGDGNQYISYPNKIIPVSLTNTYDNYVMAAKGNVLNENVGEDEIKFYLEEKKLAEYPKRYADHYGAMKVDRVVDMTNTSSFKPLRDGLDLLATKYGHVKQVNPIIYVTDESYDFKRVLKGYWKNGRKNDATLILGVDKGTKKIIWSDVITYTKNTDFIIDCQNKFKDLSISDTKSILETFGNLIASEYERRPMEEFKYMRDNIELEWYWQLTIFLFNLALSSFAFYKLLNNSERKYY